MAEIQLWQLATIGFCSGVGTSIANKIITVLWKQHNINHHIKKGSTHIKKLSKTLINGYHK